jgi:hypothetical protein
MEKKEFAVLIDTYYGIIMIMICVVGGQDDVRIICFGYLKITKSFNTRRLFCANSCLAGKSNQRYNMLI